MNTGADAADQIVRMTLNGVEVAAKITGTGAKELAVLLYAILQDQKKTSGKTRLNSMLKSGKELRVFAVKDQDLEKFCKEAKKYGVLYCVLKDRDSTDGLTDIMVRAEDASKINRIFERFNLATVDVGQIEQELARASAQQAAQAQHLDSRTPEGAARLVADLMQPPPPPREESREGNPTVGRPEKPNPSVPSSEPQSNIETPSRDTPDPFPRTSIRGELNKIKAQQKGQQGKPEPHRQQHPQHVHHRTEKVQRTHKRLER